VSKKGSRNGGRPRRTDQAAAQPPAPAVAATEAPKPPTSAVRAAIEPRVGPVRRALRGWVELWDRREPPTALALVRILIAAVMLADLLQAYSYGLVDVIWAPPPDGLAWGGQAKVPAAAARWFGATVETGWLLWWTAVVASLLVMAGVATRVSVLLLALTWAQLGHMASDGDRGIDYMLRGCLLVLAFSQCHARWSVDAWVRRKIGRPFPELIPAWPRYLLFAQLIWIYFSAGHNKSDKAWGPLENFEALGNILCDPHFARFDPSWVATFYPMLQLGTLATISFELGAPAMILLTWWDATRDRPGRLRRLSNLLRLRWMWIATGVIFHVGIAVTMRLGIFPWGLLALYPVLFHPEELTRAGVWLQARAPRFFAPRSTSG
jgi:hypothetical protein